jgi:murein L,D-transpeptidase YcbB/YkuD
MPSSIFAAFPAAALVLATAPLFAQPAENRAPTLIPVGAADVRALLEGDGSPQPLCATAEGRTIWTAVQAFYAARADEPVWFEGSALTPAGRGLVAALRASADEGLDPLRYEPVMLVGGAPRVLRASLAGDGLAVQASALEVGLTAALARFAADLGRGRVDPTRVTVLWRLRPRGFDALPVLQQVAASGRPDVVLDSIRPAHPQYAALREAFRHYAALAESEGDVPAVTKGVRLRPGAKGAAVRALRARLAFWGDLEDTAGPGDLFDRVTVDAVKRFQARHGFAVDGVASPEVVAALNTPVRERLRQIALNLERWRWQERTAGPRSVLVNIPAFELHAYDGDHEALAMRVITGSPDTPTPVFAQPMTSVVLSPYWNVPVNIALDETMPAVRRDRGYLRRLNLEVLRGDQVVDPARVDFRRDVQDLSFRQRPGASNSLGLVKFELPNPFNVYLHDTPNDALFLRPRRTFSHGCVRLEKPEALARWVLGDVPGWSPARIAAAMHAGRENTVPLPAPIPVSIGYFTVWVDGDGTVRFLPDVYRHDLAQGSLLDEPGAAAPPALTVATMTAAR